MMIISAPFRDNNPRLAAIAVSIGIGMVLLLVSLFRVQVIHGDRYGSRESAQSLRRIRLPSARGEIVDRAGVILANNRPSYDIAIYLDQLGRVSKRQDVARIAEASILSVSTALGLPVSVTDRDVRLHYERRRPLPLPLWRDLPATTLAAFEERAGTLPGTDLIVTPVRQYPQGSLAAHLLGFCGKAEQNDDEEVENFFYYQADSAGKQGVERAFDGDLRGAPGGRTIRVNPGGVKVADVGDRAAERGNRLVLTIDARIQRIAEQALAHTSLPAGRDLCGTAVVLDPRSGEILAMASVPTFDPNIINPATSVATIQAIFTSPLKPMLNRAIGSRYAPGSTFKPVTLLAGLETGAITINDTAVCTGGLQIGNRKFGCWNQHGHGRVEGFTAMLQSCDVWFYQEGLRTGVDAIARVATELGLGQPTGLDYSRDYTGLVPTPAWKRANQGERWWDGDTAQMAIGQSFLLATPLQMANLAATLGNRGTRWRPFVVKRIESPDGQVLQQTQPTVMARLSAKPQNIETVRQALRGAIQSPQGTGHHADVNNLSVAGKTGTAEFDLREGNTTRRIKRAWFIGFAPYDQPSVAVAVLIENGDSGGHTAAPVAGQILAGIFQRLPARLEEAMVMPINQQVQALKRMDWWLTAAMLVMAVASVAFIYSASYRGPGQPMSNYYKMQMVWFGVGLALYVAATVVDYRLICHWSAVWYITAVCALLLVLVAGAKVSGARRWLGWHGLGIQPSEVAKLAVLVTVAYYLFHRTPEQRRRWSTVWGTLGILAVPQALIFAQPDLGSAVILMLMTLGLMFVAGVRVKHLVILGLLGLLAAPVLWMSMRDYQKSRLTVFLDPDRDPLGAGWNLNQSLIAVGSGGLTGKGYLQGTQNLLGYLPRTVAPNDFLFSVIAEEKGFTGSVCVLGLFAVILFSGLRIAANARDRLGMLLATGIVVLLFFHVFINIGMTIGLMPVKGLPLPLLSYGGSFVLATMTALGLLQNVWIHRRAY